MYDLKGKVWLSTEDAARYLGRSKNAIRILVSRGVLVKRKWNRRLYFKRSELDFMIEESLNMDESLWE